MEVIEVNRINLALDVEDCSYQDECVKSDQEGLQNLEPMRYWVRIRPQHSRLLNWHSHWIGNELWLANKPLYMLGFPVSQRVKNMPAMWETWAWSLGQEDPLEKGMATHPTILTWRIPWMEGPTGLWSRGLQRIWHNWMTNKQFYMLNIFQVSVSMGSISKHCILNYIKSKSRLILGWRSSERSGRESSFSQNLTAARWLICALLLSYKTGTIMVPDSLSCLDN